MKLEQLWKDTGGVCNSQCIRLTVGVAHYLLNVWQVHYVAYKTLVGVSHCVRNSPTTSSIFLLT